MFNVQSLDEQHGFLVALFKTLFPDADVSAMSDNYLWAMIQAAGVTDNHAHIESVKTDLMPDTSESDMLDRWAIIRGVARKGATSARKANALRVVGIAATAVPANAELVHDSSGLRFKITTASVVGPTGFVDVDVAAIDTGSATRLNAGERMTFSTPIANLEDEAELQSDIDEDGTDQESDGALRLRVLSRFRNPALGGAQEDYVQWALEEVGIAAAYAYPLRAGLGTVDVAALHAGSGDARALTGPEVGELQAVLDEKRPISVGGFRVLSVVTQTTNVEVTILTTGEAQYEFDWDDSIAPTGNSWNAGTRVFTLDADRPTSMKAGDRLTLSDGATGRERVIESLSGTAAVVLEDDQDGDIPTAASIVYSGGPIVQTARAAILALIDGLGTANPDTTRYGSWEGNLRPSAIGRVATNVTGVLDGEVVVPSATIVASDPAFPNDAQIGLIIPGRVLVRKQH
ncbi:MAG: baseplate J/gp47 family protein [Chloroflexi bacterium]|nr:baseplate J/gp47 family protein [Chloroflexota bacterium]